MKQLAEFLRTRLGWILCGILVVTFLWLVPRACSVKKLELRSAHLQGEIGILRAEADAREATYGERKIEWEKAVAERDEQIAMANCELDSLNTVIVARDETIERLSGDLDNAQTDAERVPIMARIIEEYKLEVFSLKQALGEKDKIIFSITEKYQWERKLRLEAEAGWSGERVLRGKLEGQREIDLKIIRKLKAEATLWKLPVGVAVAVGAVFGVIALAK